MKEEWKKIEEKENLDKICKDYNCTKQMISNLLKSQTTIPQGQERKDQ